MAYTRVQLKVEDWIRWNQLTHQYRQEFLKSPSGLVREFCLCRCQ
jgi:hypothetical protein